MQMLIVFLSLTGNVKKFVSLLDMDSLEIDYNGEPQSVNRDYILIVPTYDDEITEIISRFINHSNNIDYLKGFVGSGNKNFGDKYIFNAKELSEKYNQPIVFDFEVNGENDVSTFKKEVSRIEITRTQRES